MLQNPEKTSMVKDISLIPKDTQYCYSINNITDNSKIKTIPCPFLDWDDEQPQQENGYCHYLGCGDFTEDGTSLLWDSCKECGISM